MSSHVPVGNNRIQRCQDRMLKDMVAVLASVSSLRRQLATPLYRNAIYLVIGNASTGVFGLAFWLVAARLHDADTVGSASAAISAMLLLSMLGTLGLDYAVIRFLPRAANARAMINTSLTVSAVAAAAMSLVFVAGLGLWSPVLNFIQRDPLFLGGFVVFTTAHSVFFVQTKTFVARRRAEFSLGQALCLNVLRLALLVVFAFSFGVFGIASAWGLAVVLALMLGAVLFQPRLEPGYWPVPTIAGKVVGQLVRYSFTNYVAAMLWTAPGYVLPLLVANKVGAEFNAYFYIAWSMANALFQIPLAICFSLFAEGSSDERSLGVNIRRTVRLMILIEAPVLLVLAIFGDSLLGFFDLQYAQNAAGLLRILAISTIPLSVNCIYFVVERVRMRMLRLIGVNAFLAAATVGLSWVLLPRMGLDGAGIAWIASQSATALVVLFIFTLHRRWMPDSGHQDIST